MLKKLFTIFCLLFMSVEIAHGRTYYECAEAADSLIAVGNLGEAESVLLEALRAEPANPLNSMLLSNLGIVRHRTGNYAGALEALDAAVAMTPNSTVAINNRARVRISMQDYSSAIEDLDRVLDIDPRHVNARLTRGSVSLMLKRTEEAIADFKTVLNGDEGNAEALAGMAHALETQSDFEGALQYYNRAMAESGDAELLVDRALLKIRLGDLRGADEDVREGLTKWGTDGNLILIRGYLARLRYRNKEAAEDLFLARKYGADAALIRELFPSSSK